MVNQQRLIDEYESLRRQSLACAPRPTQRDTLALGAVMQGGMVGFMRCCTRFLATGPNTTKPVRQMARTDTSQPSAELTHALAEMVLTIVTREHTQ